MAIDPYGVELTLQGKNEPKWADLWYISSQMVPDSLIPEENLSIYKQLFIIEVGLREFIIERLSERFGFVWWKSRLPEDVLTSYKEGRKYERNIKWCQAVPHHPLYYVEFPDLKKILQRSDNWRDVFEPFLKNKDVLAATLTELEPIRNKIAHNRKSSSGDLSIVQAALKKIAALIGEEYLLKLASRCTSAQNITAQLSELQAFVKETFSVLKECKSVDFRPADEIMHCWWFDEDYLGSPIEGIEQYFETVATYSKLPRLRGSGHRIMNWLQEVKMDEQFERAMRELSTLLEKADGI